MRPLLLAALLLSAVLPLQGCSRVSDAVFGRAIEGYLMRHPQVIENAAMRLEEVKANDAQAQTKGALQRYRAQLEHDSRDFVANPAGKITVVEFFDYRCGYCKRAAPEIIQLIAENPDVRFVFKEFPILSAESNQAAAYALAGNSKGKYLSLYRAFFAQNALDGPAIDRIVANEGLDVDAMKAQAGGAAVQKHLADNHKLAAALGVNGTPMFFVGDTLVEGADIPGLKVAIEKARKPVA